MNYEWRLTYFFSEIVCLSDLQLEIDQTVWLDIISAEPKYGMPSVIKHQPPYIDQCVHRITYVVVTGIQWWEHTHLLRIYSREKTVTSSEI